MASRKSSDKNNAKGEGVVALWLPGEGVNAPVQLRHITRMWRYLLDFCGTECPINIALFMLLPSLLPCFGLSLHCGQMLSASAPTGLIP